jgi:hypothetical protein
LTARQSAQQQAQITQRTEIEEQLSKTQIVLNGASVISRQHLQRATPVESDPDTIDFFAHLDVNGESNPTSPQHDRGTPLPSPPRSPPRTQQQKQQQEEEEEEEEEDRIEPVLEANAQNATSLPNNTGTETKGGEEEGLLTKIKSAAVCIAKLLHGSAIAGVEAAVERMQQETFPYRKDSASPLNHGSDGSNLWEEICWFALVRSHHLFYLMIVVAVMINGNGMAIVYAIGLFMWGAVSAGPYPSKPFVNALTYYAVAVLVVKYAARIVIKLLTNPFDDAQRNFYDTVGVTMKSSCDGLAELSCNRNAQQQCYWVDEACVQLPSFQIDLLPDALLILSLFAHRLGQTRLGFWATKVQQKEEQELSAATVDAGSSVATTTVATAAPDAELTPLSNSSTTDPDPSTNDETASTTMGRDYYFASFSLQFLGLLIGIFGYSSGFSTATEQSVSTSTIVLEGVVPVAFIVYLIFQLVMIVLDRVVYVLLSGRLKRYFHLVSVVLIHVLVFIVLVWCSPFKQLFVLHDTLGSYACCGFNQSSIRVIQ